jgi:hypothetical protein
MCGGLISAAFAPLWQGPLSEKWLSTEGRRTLFESFVVLALNQKARPSSNSDGIYPISI